ncbi:hypothetical protein NDU88_004722 [Pleurodeles waltl]|uniref:Uncharacterized protein n=1 Tax=Pleurodeles waltl TaxID=8319 RepID=A0AAV7UFW6_PLEWA|nr:hypothetical protein NDU88_004722 [Pleurodeles waltl]
MGESVLQSSELSQRADLQILPRTQRLKKHEFSPGSRRAAVEPSSTTREGTAGAVRGPCGSRSPQYNAIPGGRSSSNGAGSLADLARRQRCEVRGEPEWGPQRRGTVLASGSSFLSPPTLLHQTAGAAALRTALTRRAGHPRGRSGAAGESVRLNRTPGVAPLRGPAAQRSKTRQENAGAAAMQLR